MGNNTIAVNAITNAPANAAHVPKTLIAPEVPVSVGFHVRTEIGFFLLNEPISEAHVSELAAASKMEKTVIQMESLVNNKRY